MKHSPVLHKKLYALYKQNGLTEQRREIVLQFTGGRTDNSSEMTEKEIIALINALQTPKTATGSKERAIKKLFHLCHLYGWQKFDPEKGKDVVDVDSLNAWLVKYGKFHKELNSHTPAELGKVITQFEFVVNKLLKTI